MSKRNYIPKIGDEGDLMVDGIGFRYTVIEIISSTAFKAIMHVRNSDLTEWVIPTIELSDYIDVFNLNKNGYYYGGFTNTKYPFMFVKHGEVPDVPKNELY